MIPRAFPHGGERGQLARRTFLNVYCGGAWVQGGEPGEDIGLEGLAALNAALGYERGRQQLARVQDVPLRPYGATRRNVGALRHDQRYIVTSRHGAMVRARCEAKAPRYDVALTPDLGFAASVIDVDGGRTGVAVVAS